MESSPLNLLPQDTLLQIFRHLSLPQIATVRCVCRSLHALLSSPQNLNPELSLRLLSLKPSSSSHGRHVSSPPQPTLHAFDACSNRWLRFNLDFLPYTLLLPITSSRGLLYLWASNGVGKNGNSAPQQQSNANQKALVVCNPLTGKYRTLPQLGSAWSKHGSVLTSSTVNVVLVLTELAILYYNPDNQGGGNSSLIPDRSDGIAASSTNNWLKFTSNLPSKPRSPVFISDFILALCDVGSPWRSQWAMFKTKIFHREVNHSAAMRWERVEKKEWGDILDVLKRPRLVRAGDDRKVFMVGGLKSSYALQSTCTTILILRLDLETLEWEEAGRMPNEMYRCFAESSKFKVFGGGNRVCFSAKRVGKLALWEEFDDGGRDEWRWVEAVPGGGDGLSRGFVFEARLDVAP